MILTLLFSTALSLTAVNSCSQTRKLKDGCSECDIDESCHQEEPTSIC